MIRPPALDDRSFDDLVNEMLARIPAHTPEWTNPRPGDPGRTIVELFAWLADTILYRANLIPERQRLAFLRLLGIQMRPAIPARGLVRATIDEDAPTKAVIIQPLASIKGPVPFETGSELTVLPITAEPFYKRAVSEDEIQTLGDVVLGLQEVYQVPAVEPYVTTPVFAGGNPVPGGFDLVGQTTDRCLWLALLAAKPELKEDVRQTLGTSETGGAQLISVGLEPSLAVPDLFEDIGPRARVPFLWEVTGTVERDGSEQTVYHRLEVISDSTQGLTRRGVHRLALPAAEFLGAPTNDVRQDHRAGVGDTPPRLDDPELSARLVAWLRLRPAPTADSAPPQRMSFSWVGINAVEIEARQTFRGRLVGQSDGSADQEFALPGRAVEPASLSLEVETAGHGFQVWQQIDELALAARDQPVYRLDSESGSVQFGDGARGLIPAAGTRIRVAQMRAGGGQTGNLAAGSLSDMTARLLGGQPVTNLKVSQDLPTSGGQDAETLVEAEQRIPAMLRHRERAVTRDDYARLALDTPAVQIGRVEVLPKFKPLQRRFSVPGVVSVMVLPATPGNQPPNPRPDRPMLEAVHEYVSARRPLGTELYVVGCEYVPLGLTVGVTIRDGFERESVLAGVRDALRSYLWPLPPLGQLGTGWTLGHPVRDRELEVAVARVPGVSGLIDPGVNLFRRKSTGQESLDEEWEVVRRADPHAPLELPIEPWQLPELLSVVAVADEPPPVELRGIPNPFASQTSVGVPVIPDVC